jgi:ribonuclease HII
MLRTVHNLKLSTHISPLWTHDLDMQKKFPVFAGVDEAGRGPLAGNVVAACVILNLKFPIPEINDSKKLTEKTREKLFAAIKENALYCGVGECSPAEIDKYNILRASLKAMQRAVENAGCSPDLILVDGNKMIPDFAYPQKTIVKGDGISASIAAASIIAKVTRDRQMQQLHEHYPEYGFLTNKGYGSKEHVEAIIRHGMTPVHRRSFKPASLLQTDLFEEGE